jgi:hypothetical protein
MLQRLHRSAPHRIARACFINRFWGGHGLRPAAQGLEKCGLYPLEGSASRAERAFMKHPLVRFILLRRGGCLLSALLYQRNRCAGKSQDRGVSWRVSQSRQGPKLQQVGIDFLDSSGVGQDTPSGAFASGSFQCRWSFLPSFLPSFLRSFLPSFRASTTCENALFISPGNMMSFPSAEIRLSPSRWLSRM